MLRIITDSASDVTKAEAEKLNVEVIPMVVRFGEKEYLDGVDLTSFQFFEKLIESREVPKTSQINAFCFQELFEKYKDDEIICITLSKKLSGTYQNACIAASDFPNVHVIDSENVTAGEKILVQLACRLRDENKGAKEIADTLNEEKKNIRLVALLDTLEYLKKGGRINAVTATIGGLLHVKPVVEILGGEVKLCGKAVGSLAGNNKLRQKIAKYDGVDFSMPVSLAYSGLSDALLKKYVKDSNDVYPADVAFEFTHIGSTIGTHIGPGAIAVAFFKNKVAANN